MHPVVILQIYLVYVVEFPTDVGWSGGGAKIATVFLGIYRGEVNHQHKVKRLERRKNRREINEKFNKTN